MIQNFNGLVYADFCMHLEYTILHVILYFRGQETMYQSLTNLVDGGTCTARIVVDFFTSSAFIVPLVIILVYAYSTIYIKH